MGFFENPMRTGLLAVALAVRDGRVTIPAGPGLGIEVDEAAVRSLDRLARAGGSAGGTVR